MPQLIAEADVQAVMQTNIALQPFIASAVVLTETLLATAGYTEATLTQIQLYLSAWLACSRDPRVSEARTDATSVKRDLVAYWDLVQLYDTKGLLDEALHRKRAATFDVF